LKKRLRDRELRGDKRRRKKCLNRSRNKYHTYMLVRKARARAKKKAFKKIS
jgi:hypothetical protein